MKWCWRLKVENLLLKMISCRWVRLLRLRMAIENLILRVEHLALKAIVC
jgi:hypothetical protein